MKKFIKQCPDCGGDNFSCKENITYSGKIDEIGSLVLSQDGFSYINNTFTCVSCGKKFRDSDFKNIVINLKSHQDLDYSGAISFESAIRTIKGKIAKKYNIKR